MAFLNKIKILTPLHKKSFRFLYLSQFFNNSGMFLDYVALNALIVYKWHLGPTVLAIFSIAYAAPMILSPIFGSIVDRSPIKRLMLISTMVTALLTLTLAIVPNVVFLIIIIFLRAFSKVFYIPLENTAIQKIFSKEELIQANSLVQFLFQAFVVIGPILGALLLSFVHVRSVFIVTSLCYLFSFVTICFLSAEFNKIHKSESLLSLKTNYLELKEMVLLFIKQKKLFLGFFSLALTLFCYFLAESLLVLLAKDFGFTDKSFEYIFVMLGLGGIVGALTLGNRKSSTEPVKIILYGIILMGTTFIFSAGVCPILTNLKFLLFLLSWFFTGVGMSMVNIGYSVLIMKNVSSDMIGKASTLLLFSNGISVCFGPVLGAGLANLYNIYVPFVSAGFLMVIIFIIFRTILLVDKSI